jgi:hypothetical protein
MSYHRLTEAREIDGRLRPAGTILDHQGAPVAFLEPLDVAEHTAWLTATAAIRDAAAVTSWSQPTVSRAVRVSGRRRGRRKSIVPPPTALPRGSSPGSASDQV